MALMDFSMDIILYYPFWIFVYKARMISGNFSTVSTGECSYSIV